MTTTSKKNIEVSRVRFVAINNSLDTEDLVALLEITPEDILDRFEDRMYEHKDKFIPDGYMVNDDDLEQETEEPNSEEIED